MIFSIFNNFIDMFVRALASNKIYLNRIDCQTFY